MRESGPIRLVCMYGWVSSKKRTGEVLGGLMEEMDGRGEDYIIGGDFNVEAHEMRRAIAERDGIKGHRVLSAGPTCHTRNGQSEIDYFVISQGLGRACWRAKDH